MQFSTRKICSFYENPPREHLQNPARMNVIAFEIFFLFYKFIIPAMHHHLPDLDPWGSNPPKRQCNLKELILPQCG